MFMKFYTVHFNISMHIDVSGVNDYGLTSHKQYFSYIMKGHGCGCVCLSLNN